jgi:hypothetical protein
VRCEADRSVLSQNQKDQQQSKENKGGGLRGRVGSNNRRIHLALRRSARLVGVSRPPGTAVASLAPK